LQLLELGRSENDQSIVMEGHFVTGASIAFMGDLEGGLPHLDRAIELFDARVHGAERFRLGPHTGVSARVASGLLLWQAGALEQAVSRVGQALAIANQLNHPYSIAYALYHNGFLEVGRSRPEECRRRARQLAEVASRHDYPVWSTLATVLEGISLTLLGQREEGLSMAEAGVELYQGLTTPPVFWPLLLNLRGWVHGLAGHPRRGLELIDEAIGLDGEVAPPGFHLTKGDVLLMLPEPAEPQAEEAYEAALHASREGGLRLLELQALTRLVGLRRRRGLQPDRSEELRRVYDGFTEGLEEHDLRAARELLGIEAAPSSA
jgi:tetratricopeptide (TPR) repeat protein